jgi:hypothetical protein
MHVSVGMELARYSVCRVLINNKHFIFPPQLTNNQIKILLNLYRRAKLGINLEDAYINDIYNAQSHSYM